MSSYTLTYFLFLHFYDLSYIILFVFLFVFLFTYYHNTSVSGSDSAPNKHTGDSVSTDTDRLAHCIGENDWRTQSSRSMMLYT